MVYNFKYLLASLLLIIIAGCGGKEGCAHQKEIELLKSQIAEYENSETTSPEMGFQHIVYFDIKDDLSKAERVEFENIIDTLPNIPGVTQFKSAQFKELGDSRALSKYEYIVMMSFVSIGDYHAYQGHPLHLAVKERSAKYLSGPPVSYDLE